MRANRVREFFSFSGELYLENISPIHPTTTYSTVGHGTAEGEINPGSARKRFGRVWFYRINPVGFRTANDYIQKQ